MVRLNPVRDETCRNLAIRKVFDPTFRVIIKMAPLGASLILGTRANDTNETGAKRETMMAANTLLSLPGILLTRQISSSFMN